MWLVIWRFCVSREEPKFFTAICDFTTLFYVILWCKSSKWLYRRLSRVTGMRFAIWNLDLAIWDFAFFKHCPYCKNRSLKIVFYLLFFVNRENEIVMYVIGDPLFFLFVNCTRDPPVRPSCYSTSVDNNHVLFLTGFNRFWDCMVCYVIVTKCLTIIGGGGSIGVGEVSGVQVLTFLLQWRGINFSKPSAALSTR